VDRAGRGPVALVAAAFVQDVIGHAIGVRDEALAAAEGLAPLYARFVATDHVPSAVLAELRLVRPAPDKVLRAVHLRASPGAEGSGLRVLVAADAAAAIVLRHGLATPPSMAQLQALVGGARGSGGAPR